MHLPLAAIVFDNLTYGSAFVDRFDDLEVQAHPRSLFCLLAFRQYFKSESRDAVTLQSALWLVRNDHFDGFGFFQTKG